MSSLTLEQEIFLLAQAKADKIVAKYATNGSGRSYPDTPREQSKANTIRDNFIDFLKDVEKLTQMLDPVYAKARRVACDFIEYPIDEADVQAIKNATPLQAIEALEDRIKQLMRIPDAKRR